MARDGGTHVLHLNSKNNESRRALAGWNSLTAGLSLDRSGKPTEGGEEAGGDGEESGGLEHGGFESLHDTARPRSVSSRIPSVRQHTKTVQRLMEAFVPSGRPCPPVYQRLATSELLPSRSNRSSILLGPWPEGAAPSGVVPDGPAAGSSLNSPLLNSSLYLSAEADAARPDSSPPNESPRRVSFLL
ncbi:hypothetical protein EMIHUDRAFT_207077 [Emiliania huxleyi CCMP1516]|uniref:Uncharacterized protein n=2 Tax=Emiliania huxleyi TaxID=2903 RepID=A0A0D3JKJ4_EMIH1|nr:hypothetical protein EMIHUDRAFT_207077 [Emiliania huxleyi CCMP1516]EOD24029.1 hypothetical protein EMIHUDRAFT_207077 [Emiliania huxleyi CCMP1516]|eukprot:XP_005776458.1 hypothetical protein EMIHUDRAFT_207077 [Emiliania huxleyi CCMP1516]